MLFCILRTTYRLNLYETFNVVVKTWKYRRKCRNETDCNIILMTQEFAVNCLLWQIYRTEDSI